MNLRPRWCYHYLRRFNNFSGRIQAYTKDNQISVSTLQSSLSMDYVFKHYFYIKDEDKKHEILAFVFMRNLLRLQNFSRGMFKTKHDAAFKIQRKVKYQNKLKLLHEEVNFKVDQL
jgi:hypothetical protein